MKKFRLLAASAALLLAATVNVSAKDVWTPPEFVESDWVLLGEGTYVTGLQDNWENEYPYDLPCNVWKSLVTEGDYWIHVDGSEIPVEANDEDVWYRPAPGDFILHAANKDKVYTDPIWVEHPMLFCYYQRVPESIGAVGSAEYYAKMNEKREVLFPVDAYRIEIEFLGTFMGNQAGTMAIYLPNESGVESVEAADAPAEYFNLQGVKVVAPAQGTIYIVKKDGKVSKEVF